jgi:hypothetical protein
MGENTHRCRGVTSCSALDTRIGTVRFFDEKTDGVGLHMRSRSWKSSSALPTLNMREDMCRDHGSGMLGVRVLLTKGLG